MKKLISICLLIALLVNLFPVLSFADDTLDEAYFEKVKLMDALNVLDADSAPSPNTKVTRGEFVKYLLNLLDKGDMVTNSGIIFWDVVETNDYFKYVSIAKALGLVNGNPDGSFEPYSYISPVEASVIMINALGYGPLVKLRGNYPASVYSLVSELDISSCIRQNKQNLDFEGMITLFYESLNTYVCETPSISIENTSFEKSEETLLEYYRDIKKIDGVLECPDITSSVNGLRRMIINDVNILNVTSYFDSFVGYEVELWAYDNNKTYDFIYMLKTLSNEVVEISFDNISDVNSNYIEYEENSKVKTEKLYAHIKFFYNDVKVDFSKYTFDDLFKKNYGNVCMIDNNADGKCDVVHVKAYDTVVVKAYDKTSYSVYDYNSPKNNINLDDFEVFEIYDANGNIITDLVPLNVLTVTKSLDKEFVKIVVSDKIIEGKIDEIDDENNVLILGNEYYVTDELKTGEENYRISPKTEGKFHLDINNRVAYITVGDENKYTSAFLVGVNAEGNSTSRIKLRLFKADNEYTFFNIAESVRIDGKTYKIKDDILEAIGFSETDFTPKPIAYGVNEAGEINYVDTPYKNPSYEDDTTLICRFDGDETNMLFYKGSSNVNYRKVFGGRYISGNDDLVVMINEKDDWDDLQVVTGMSDDVSYEVDIYSFSPDSPFGNIVLVKGTAAAAVDRNVYLFEGKKRVVDKSEKYAYLTEIKCYRSATQSTLYIAPENESILTGANVISENAKTNLTEAEIKACYGLKPGDLFRVGLDAQGYIIKFEKLYDYENGIFLNPVANAAVKNQNSAFEGNSSNRLLIGNVYLVTKGYARFSVEEFDVNDKDLDSKLESIYAVGYMYEVDKNDNLTLTKIDANSSLLGRKYGEDLKIFIQAEYTRPQNVYYIK